MMEHVTVPGYCPRVPPLEGTCVTFSVFSADPMSVGAETQIVPQLFSGEVGEPIKCAEGLLGGGDGTAGKR